MGKPCGRGRDGIKDRPMYHCLTGKTGAVSRVVLAGESLHHRFAANEADGGTSVSPSAAGGGGGLRGNELWTVRGTKCGGDGGGPVLPCLGGGHVPGTMSRRRESACVFRRVCRAFARLLDWAVASEEEQLVLVVHGGTQMAVMEAFAIPSRPYFSWGLPCGQGYVLEAEGWLEHRQLRLLGKRDYTKGG